MFHTEIIRNIQYVPATQSHFDEKNVQAVRLFILQDKLERQTTTRKLELQSIIKRASHYSRALQHIAEQIQPTDEDFEESTQLLRSYLDEIGV